MDRRRRREEDAAQYAAYTNFDGTPDVFRRKSEILAGHCRDVGTDFAKITRSANYNVVIGDTEKDVQDRLAWIRSHYEPYVPADMLDRTVEQFASGPLVGTPEQVVEKLTEADGMGMTYAILYFSEVAYDQSSLDLFVQKVAPALAER